jgi:hypothetical protein
MLKTSFTYAEFMEADRQKHEHKRRREKLFVCAVEGFSKPQGKIFFLLAIICFGIALFRYAGEILRYITADTPFSIVIAVSSRLISGFTETERIIPLAHGLLLGIGVLLFVFLVIAVMALMGMPKNANSIDACMAAVLIKKDKDSYKRPFLISAKTVTRNVTEYAFYSRWIPRSIWETSEIETAIFTVLDCIRVEKFRYGTRRRFFFFGKEIPTQHIVVFRAYRGAEISERGNLIDDEI